MGANANGLALEVSDVADTLLCDQFSASGVQANQGRNRFTGLYECYDIWREVGVEI